MIWAQRMANTERVSVNSGTIELNSLSGHFNVYIFVPPYGRRGHWPQHSHLSLILFNVTPISQPFSIRTHKPNCIMWLQRTYGCIVGCTVVLSCSMHGITSHHMNVDFLLVEEKTARVNIESK